MLLTLNANSLRAALSGKAGPQHLTLNELPTFTRQTLGLNGLTVPTTMLAGLGREAFSALREHGDRAGCSILSIIEDQPLPLGSDARDEGAGAMERLGRIIKAGYALGCSAVIVKVAAKAGDEPMARTIERLKEVADQAERLEVSILLMPHTGLTSTTEGLTTVIKRVGGFRLGACPDFESAAAHDDPALFMRRVTPYASAAIASTRKFVVKSGGKEAPARDDDLASSVEHVPYSLETMVKAMGAVGYDGSLAIEYRGEGDATLGVLRTRAILESALASVQREEE